MIHQLIQRHLMERAKAVGYISHVGGLIETVNKQDGDRRRNVPAYRQDFKFAEYVPVLPDDYQSAVLFFRQVGGLQRDTANRNIEAYNTRLRAVLWYNADRLQMEVAPDISAMLAGVYKDFGTVARAVVKPAALLSQDEAFGEYRGFDLSEQETQFLAPPFNMVAVDFSVYIVARKCRTNPLTADTIC